jgi:hypothetical protein
MLRHIHVASKTEMKAPTPTYLDDIDRNPVIHHWTHQIA